MEDNKYLKLARQAREEDNTEDAKRFYDMVRTEDPENGEAKFFYAYYALYEGKNMEIPTRFANLCKILMPSIKRLIESENEEKEKIITDIVNAFVPQTWNLNRYMNHQKVGTGNNRKCIFEAREIGAVSENGMQVLYELGDFLEANSYFSLACVAWKEAISLQQKWYSSGTKGDPEKYTEKVKKYEPSYEMPKKAGCITLADKKN